MYRKRIILILTSRDESDDISQKIAEAIRKIGTHNAVVMSDDKYGSATKLSALDKLMDSGSEYQYLLEKKTKACCATYLNSKVFQSASIASTT